MPTRSAKVDPADFAALATLANTQLLPLINAAVAASTWPGHPYDKYTGASLTNPQPAYTFSTSSATWIAELNRIRGDYWTLIFNSGLGADDLFQSPDNLTSGPWVVGINDEATFPNTQFPSLLNDEAGNPFDDFVMQGILLGFDEANAPLPAFKGVQFIFDEADSFLFDDFGGNCGACFSDVAYGHNNVGNPPGLGFNFAAALGGTWTCEVYFQFTYSGSLPDASTFTKTVTPDYGWVWFTVGSGGNGVLIAKLANYALAASTATLDFSITAGPGTFPVVTVGGNQFYYGFIVSDLVFETAVEVVPIATIHPTAQTMALALPDIPDNALMTFALINPLGGFFGNNAQYRWALSNYIPGVWTAKTLPVPALNVYLAQDMPPYVGLLAGDLFHADPIAVSATLPAYAFGGETVNSIDFEWIDNPPTTQPDNGQPSFLDSMRQSAALYRKEWTTIVGGFTVDVGPEYNYIEQSVQAQPAQWIVKRDTDLVPFDYGFNTGQSVVIYSNQVALRNGALNYLSLSSLDLVGATSLKIRLVKAGTAAKGWKNGALQYGDDLAENLTIYASNSTTPSPSDNDFETTNNEVTIPTDGGERYLDGILILGVEFAIQNTDPTQDIEYDMVVEIDTVANPVRQYFPNCWECYSYSTDGTPWLSPWDGFSVSDAAKPVPQSGYCIFKVRATRLPVKNSAGISITPSSGDDISIVLGQNKLQLDGTLSFAPFLKDQMQLGAGDTNTGAGDTSTGAGGTATLFTIKIAANARDSGDVDVFIPVLGGNELVWQCGEGVIVEAWANWQPQFNFGYFGRFPPTYAHSDAPAYQFVDQSAVAYQFALSFVNWYDNQESNVSDTHVATHTQFPISVEIIEDLTACLNLI